MTNIINNIYNSTALTAYNGIRGIQNDDVEKKTVASAKDQDSNGDNVIVELSEDGLAKLKENKFQAPDIEWRKWLENQHIQNQKEWERSGAVVQNVERRIIPNIQLNDKLVSSLSGSSTYVVGVAYSIINDDLLSHDGTMTEEKRMELISLGIEKAKYLSENYMTKEKANEFMSAINMIAKIGANGKADRNGIVRYDIPKGPLVGAPDDNINEFDVMKENDSSAWNEYSTMMNEAVKNDDKEKMVSAMKYALDWSRKMHKEKSRIFDDQIKNYSKWKERIENTRIADSFSGIDRTSKEKFLLSANGLNNYIKKEKFEENLNKFFMQLEKIK